jgi:L-lactate dehydrogenase complex protein LldG
VARAVTESRAAVLAALRQALHGSRSASPVPRRYRVAGADGGVTELFCARVAAYQARVQRCHSDALAATLAGIADAAGMKRVAITPGITLADSGAEVLIDGPELDPAVLADVDAVFTGCALGIAETGTVVLDGGLASGRRALSLVPDHHVCVIGAEQIVRGLPEAMARLSPRCPLTFVSGPSATSDIELERVDGVHGPRTLDVVVVSDLSAAARA